MMGFRLLIGLVVAHLICGMIQVAVSYYAGDVADHGAAGIVSHTPIGSFVELDEDQRADGGGGLSDIRGMFQAMIKVGDSINGLASFDYGWIEILAESDGMVGNLATAFRIGTALAIIAMALALLYFLFDSGMLTSKAGLAILAFGAGLGGLSTLGALF